MSSDSSEDENIEQLREAADNDFFTEELYYSDKSKLPAQQPKHVQKPSLRHQAEENLNDLNVTPGFQKFVASHLIKLLDSQIKEKKLPLKNHTTLKLDGGIRLFCTSTDLISCDNENPPSDDSKKGKKFTRPVRKEMCEVSNAVRCQDVAVSAEWITSQEATCGWEPCTKGRLETYAAKDVEIIGNSNKQSETTIEEKIEKKRLKRQKSRQKLKLRKKI